MRAGHQRPHRRLCAVRAGRRSVGGDNRRPDIQPPFWREHDIDLLEGARNADGRKLKIVRVLSPRRRYWKHKPESFAACYLNAYVANGAVIGAKFGDIERDEAARKALANAFPGREIIMLRIDAIANGGGGVHCVTQGMPDGLHLAINAMDVAIAPVVQAEYDVRPK